MTTAFGSFLVYRKLVCWSGFFFFWLTGYSIITTLFLDWFLEWALAAPDERYIVVGIRVLWDLRLHRNRAHFGGVQHAISQMIEMIMQISVSVKHSVANSSNGAVEDTLFPAHPRPADEYIWAQDGQVMGQCTNRCEAQIIIMDVGWRLGSRRI